MNLYLIQHGEAVSKDVDADRPLSEAGSSDIRRLAATLARMKVAPERILHSGKTRAQQSAEGIAIALGRRAQVSEGLAAMDELDVTLSRLEDWSDDTVLVGHQPFMGKLTSHLLAGDADATMVAFVPGTALCLQRDEGGNWQLQFMLPPEVHDI